MQYCPLLLKEIPDMAINLGIITKKELEISRLCNGNRTVEQIQKELGEIDDSVEFEEVEDLLKSMVKKKFIKMRFLIE